MVQEKKELKVNVDLGKTITVDEATVAHNQREFFIDLRKVTPRFNLLPISENEQVHEMLLNIEHFPIVTSPELAKALLQALSTEVQKYETNFGQILDTFKKNKASSAGDQSYIG